MTIEESKAVAQSDPQDSKNGRPSSQDDLESLVRLLANQSTQLAKRVALLEGERSSNSVAQDGGSSKLSSPPDAGPKSNFEEEFNSNRNEDNNMLCPQVAKSLEIAEGVPEQYSSIEEALDDRFALIERRLEKCEGADEKVSIDDREYELAESTFSLLVTHHPLTIPFTFAVFSVALSISCLCLTLASSINKGTKGNTLAIPAGVDGMVRAAQFLGELYLSCVFLWGRHCLYALQILMIFSYDLY